ncbi:MAG: extracellular solute-binding protein [Clostridia bacterium]|nr:extracellular solute-binding protein [Clostridia bacterium]
MSIKKIISIILAGVMAASLVSCGEEQSSSDGVMKITWMGFPMDADGKADGYVEKTIEERFNVDIEPVFIRYSEYTDQKTMMFAGGKVPDVIYEMDPSHVQADADQGFLAKLDYSKIKEKAPDIFNVINDNQPLAWLYSRAEDENYGIPNLNYANDNIKIGVWREDWLKNVGIDKIPDTVDEMGEALNKLTYNDPDGNGKNDTYGMSGTLAWNGMFIDIFGAYNSLPFGWIEKDGKVVYGGLQDETKDALTKLAEWYADGVIHPDFITDSTSGTVKEKFVNGQIGYISEMGGYYDKTDVNAFQNLTMSLNPEAVITNAAPVQGPEGHRGSRIWGSACHIGTFGSQLEKDEAKLDKILEILNTMVADEELMLKLRIGEEGTHWKLKDGAADISEGIEFIAPYDDTITRTSEGFVYNFGSPSFFMPVTPTKASYEKYTLKEMTETYKAAAKDSVGMVDAFMKADTLPSSTKYFNDLRTKQIKLMSEVILGDKTADQYMSEFKALWEQYGGLELEADAQNMQNVISDIYASVGITE